VTGKKSETAIKPFDVTGQFYHRQCSILLNTTLAINWNISTVNFASSLFQSTVSLMEKEHVRSSNAY
jgi:hypothetical protein